MGSSIVIVAAGAKASSELSACLAAYGHTVLATLGLEAVGTTTLRSDAELIVFDARTLPVEDGRRQAELLGATAPTLLIAVERGRTCLRMANDAGPLARLFDPFDLTALPIATELALERHALRTRLQRAEQQHAEDVERLAATQAMLDRFENALRLSSIGIWDFDMQGGGIESATIHAVNFWEPLGYPADSGGMAERMSLWHEDDRERATRTLRAYLSPQAAGGGDYETETRVRHKNGSYRWKLTRGVATRDAEGRATRFIGMSIDITELKRVQEALAAREAELRDAKEAAETANHAKDQFLANVSHEIRTPMNAILGMSELVLETPLAEDQRDLLGTVRSAARHLLGIIDDLLDYSKLQAGKLKLDPVRFDLRTEVGEVIRSLATRARQKGLELVLTIDPNVPARLVGDAGRLRQVLLNLIGNGVKFTENGAVGVHVGLADEGNGDDITLEFSVRDDGIGISRDKQKTVFAAFEQADASTTRRYGGTGLGLTIAAHLVALLGGRLSVESELGQGSEFTFMAHFSRAAADDASRPVEPPAARTDPLRVLVAEDNEFNAFLMQELLRKHGHVVRFANSGRKALELLETESFDLMLLDLHMPELDGFDVIRAVRSREGGEKPRLRVIALTARAHREDRERCLAAGMDDFLVKPLRAAELWSAIERVRPSPHDREPTSPRVTQDIREA